MSHRHLTGYFNSNIVFLFMVIAILGSVIYEQTKPKSSEESFDNETWFSRKIKENKFQIIFFLIVLGLFLIYKWSQEYQKFQEESTNDNPKPLKVKGISHMLTPEEYKKQAESTTRRELEKLYASEQFQRMLQMKAGEEANWNWQSRERQKKVVYKEEDSSDCDLSQITLTD